MKSVVLAVLGSLLVIQGPAAQTPAAAKPKLIVMISVDQMRADYIDRFQHQWTRGLKRLISDGAWFRQADFPYYNTVTCAGHASISTGAIPAVHGMVLNQWWEANNSRIVSCTDDDAQKLVSYGGPATGVGMSASNVMTPTLADELRMQGTAAPRVVSISLKGRSAVTMGGRRPDAVIWLDETSGEWVTSTAFAKDTAPYFAAYIAKHPLKDEVGRPWDRVLPTDRYLYDGSAEGRQRTYLITKDFPHVVKGTGTAGGAFLDAWESSPFSDAYLAGLAGAAIDGLKLGRGPGIDYLSVSFSALDKVGHDFGQDSHEVQDVMIRLDAGIGELLDQLDREIGKGNYLVGLSSDHGVSPVPERVKALGFDAGRISTTAVGRQIDEVLVRELGPGAYRTRVIYNDIYFNDGVYQQLLGNAVAMAAVLDTIRRTEGVARVYRKEDLSTTDLFTRQSAFSHFDGRSGDIKMLGRSHWITSSSTATHGTGHRYDTHVPVILFGHGIRKGEYLQPASPLDLAPTMAFLTGVTLPEATGRVLIEALAPRP